MSQEVPKLSVVVPVYNAERYLHQCLDSVLTQSLTEIEVICVDDGSTDGSLAILREYEARDPRVRVLTQTNQHAGPARNKGLEAATGEYVHFLDADDYVLPYAYEALYNKLVKYELDMIRCAAVNWDTERECFVEVARENLTMLRPGDFNRLVGTEAESPLFKVSVAPWAGLYRRAFLMERGIRFNDLVCVNDRSFFAAVATNAERVMIARDRLVVYRIAQGSSLIGARARNFDCQFRSLECVVERMCADGISMEVQERILDAEFTDVLVWFKKYAGDSELGERIQEQMDAFVSAFDGPFAHVLRQRYRDAVKQLDGAAAPERLAKRAKVVHEACEHPRVSVAVPVYNVEDYLNEALNSLTCQELEEMEFICVNDGSTDGSLAIMREYAALDARFRILDGPNGGYGKGMNRAIDAARGEYLGILEPDDFVPANMFRELYQVASKNDVDLVKADFNRFKVNADGSLSSKRFRLTSDASFYNRILCPVEELDSFHLVMNTWSGIYKLEFLRRWNIRHNETPGASYQDNGFWFQTFCRAERAYFVNKPYYMNRRDNPNSSMFSTGKMYCITEEYRYIQSLLEPEQELWAKVERIFYGKKLSNFFMTYFRLAPELQREYLHHLKDEFAGSYEQGLVDGSFCSEAGWFRFQEIMADPDAYYDRIRVSVIVPVYNAEPYLRQMLDSVLVRNEVQFELIAVDDGSTDGSLVILREYEARDPRVHVITQANAGAGAARNAGMALARGEYLSFLDADDFFEPEMLRLAYERAHLLDADVVVFRSDQYIEDTGKFQQLGYSIRRDLLPSEEPFAGADIQSDIFKAFVGWPWDKLFRTEFVREHGLRFPEVASSEDAFFVFSAIVAAERIATRGDVLAHHRRASGSLSVSREKSWGCFYEVLLALREQLLDMGLYERREQDFINYSAHWTLWNLNTLQGPAYYQLYDHLKSGWLAELGILSHDMGYFYNRSEWGQLQQLLAMDAEEFLFWQRDLKRALGGGAEELSDGSGNRFAVTDVVPYLANHITARLDVQIMGSSANGLELCSISDEAAILRSPAWLNVNGWGYEICSMVGELELRFECIGAGEFEVALRGMDVRGENGERVPFWIDFTALVINGKNLLAKSVAVWHDRPRKFQVPVEDGDIVTIAAAWRPHAEAERDAAREELAATKEQLSASRERAGRLRAKVDVLKGKLSASRERARSLERKNQELRATVREQRSGNKELREQVKELRAQNKKLRASNKQLAAKAASYRASLSWKIGRAVTWLPRKLRALFKRG